MTRRLRAEEEALWQRVVATVQPLHPLQKLAVIAPVGDPVGEVARAVPERRGPDRRGVGPSRAPAPAAAPPTAGPARTETLDESWDRRLGSGRLEPDITIDLHGLSRDSARHLLYRRVLDAEARGLRTILVITGKGHMPGPAPADLVPGLRIGPAPRGGIKADLPRWLGEQGLSQRIAAVRRAHPRHGGEGAAYLILKRKRG